MNARTAKLIRKLSTSEETTVRPVKKLWKRTPRNKRAALRRKILEQLKDQEEPIITM